MLVHAVFSDDFCHCARNRFDTEESLVTETPGPGWRTALWTLSWLQRDWVETLVFANWNFPWTFLMICVICVPCASLVVTLARWMSILLQDTQWSAAATTRKVPLCRGHLVEWDDFFPVLVLASECEYWYLDQEKKKLRNPFLLQSVDLHHVRKYLNMTLKIHLYKLCVIIVLQEFASCLVRFAGMRPTITFTTISYACWNCNFLESWDDLEPEEWMAESLEPYAVPQWSMSGRLALIGHPRHCWRWQQRTAPTMPSSM